jgi:hypothetical protein
MNYGEGKPEPSTHGFQGAWPQQLRVWPVETQCSAGTQAVAVTVDVQPLGPNGSCDGTQYVFKPITAIRVVLPKMLQLSKWKCNAPDVFCHMLPVWGLSECGAEPPSRPDCMP